MRSPPPRARQGNAQDRNYDARIWTRNSCERTRRSVDEAHAQAPCTIPGGGTPNARAEAARRKRDRASGRVDRGVNHLMRRSTAALLVVLCSRGSHGLSCLARERADPRGVHRQERPDRHGARRPRHVRLPPGVPFGGGSRCTAGSSQASIFRSADRGSLSGSRRSSSPSRPHSSRPRGLDAPAPSGPRPRRRGADTPDPYLVWHDVHANREVLDWLVLALLVLCALVAYVETASLPMAAVTGGLRASR